MFECFMLWGAIERIGGQASPGLLFYARARVLIVCGRIYYPCAALFRRGGAYSGGRDNTSLVYGSAAERRVAGIVPHGVES